MVIYYFPRRKRISYFSIFQSVNLTFDNFVDVINLQRLLRGNNNQEFIKTTMFGFNIINEPVIVFAE